MGREGARAAEALWDEAKKQTAARGALSRAVTLEPVSRRDWEPRAGRYRLSAELSTPRAFSISSSR